MSITAANSTSIGRKYGSGGKLMKPMRIVALVSSVLRLGQVAGDEDDEHDLQEFARLDADRAEVDPESRAVDLVAQQQGGSQEQDRDRRPRVLVVAQDPVVAQADRDGQHGHHPDPEPEQLRGRHAELDAQGTRPGQVLRQPVEHHHADGPHGADRRKDQLVSAMAGCHEEEVRAEEERGVPEGQGEVPGIERAGQRDVRHGEPERGKERGSAGAGEAQPRAR